MSVKIKIIGAGLAGVEAANYLANCGYFVDLYEKRPIVSSPAHHTNLFGELVCSNSLKSKKEDNACGILKEEIDCLGSLMMEASRASEVPGGDSLAVDRTIFANYITDKIKNNKNIKIHYENIESIDVNDGYTLICTGPLTDKTLLDEINRISGENSSGFFDASAPIIYKNSINFEKVFIKGRYDQKEEGYINCPMNKDEYMKFYHELINAKKAPLHDFDTQYFEGCLPVEIIASRGIDTLRFGPLKPKGLEHNGQEFYAVVQLRQDDLIGDFYNMVGFQTNLTYPEQKRVFSLIPGLENAKFARYGLMHRNSYVFAPKVLNTDLSMKKAKNVFICGQLSGVEGYVESASTGLLAAYYLRQRIEKKELKELSFYSVLGALTRYITHTGANNFQPMNANFGIVYKANKDPKPLVRERALKAIDDFKRYTNGN